MNTVECCGKPCDTAFCPQCGKHISSTLANAEGLLAHIHAAVLSQRTMLIMLENPPRYKKDLESRPRYQKTIERRRKTLRKWESWEQVLQELMQKAE